MKCPMKFRAESGKDACVGEECMWYVDAYGIKGCAIASVVRSAHVAYLDIGAPSKDGWRKLEKAAGE